MLAPPIPLRPAQPGQRWVMHIRAIIPALALIAGGVTTGEALRPVIGPAAWALTAIMVALALYGLLRSPTRRWRALGWAVTEDELHAVSGVWTRTHTIVPFARVQHLDVAQGPVERLAGVARLIVHTAGTAHAVVALPGLSREEADGLRDTLRTAIAAEEA